MLKRIATTLFITFIFYLFSFGQKPYEIIDIDGEKRLIVKISESYTTSITAQKPEALKDYLKIFVGDSPTKNQAAVLGKYILQERALVFTPTFSFQDGLTYTAKWKNGESFLFTIPFEENRIPTEFNAIYPSSDTLPSNQLKMYLYFSAPMSEGHVYQYIHITDQWGDTLDTPFLILEPELWNENRQRLTLWFDPGRVKRDLGPNQHKGTPLQEGKLYTLTISQDWLDAEGYPLRNEFAKTFIVGEADREKPDVKKWKINAPIVHAQTPLELIFPENLDQALLLNSIHIFDMGGKVVEGHIRIANKERKWLFYPKEVWPSGFYRIRVNAVLEDLAGNNLNRLFDRDLYDDSQQAAKHSYYWLSFEIEAIQE